MAVKATTKINVLDATQKVGEQLVSVVKQSQSFALDVARAYAQAWPPVPSRLSEVPAVVAVSDLPAVTAQSFDLAGQLLAAQKDFAVALANTFAPAKSA
jgi:hypothetical protein